MSNRNIRVGDAPAELRVRDRPVLCAMQSNAVNARVLQPEFIVDRYLSGVRVDSFLARQLRNYTSWRIARMVADGLVVVDGFPADSQKRVFRGQHVSIRLIEPPDKLLEGSFQADLEIVYEDPWLIVINKPAGLIAHPVGEFQDGTLANVLQSHLDSQTPAKGLIRTGIVHRLDRMTSGLLVITKDHLSHRHLSIDFQQKRVAKAYLALVDGRPDPAEGVIGLPIGQRPGGRTVLMSAKGTARRARAAKSGYEVKETFPRIDAECGRSPTCSLVRIVLYTGRNHQIRVHMAEIGHPVLGDEFYGPFGTILSEPREEGDEPTTQRHALHASELAFQHPILGQWMRFESSPGPDFWEFATS